MQYIIPYLSSNFVHKSIIRPNDISDQQDVELKTRPKFYTFITLCPHLNALNGHNKATFRLATHFQSIQEVAMLKTCRLILPFGLRSANAFQLVLAFAFQQVLLVESQLFQSKSRHLHLVRRRDQSRRRNSCNHEINRLIE